MKHAWKHLTPILALVFLLAGTARGQQSLPSGRPVAATDALRSALERKGYVAVSLVQEKEWDCFLVECKSGTETFRMLLDTGAADSSLDLGLVKKLGLKHEGEVNGVGIEGSRKGVKVSLCGLSIGGYDARATVDSLSVSAFDFTFTNTDRKRSKLPRIDGLLGNSTLRANFAVIDYQTRTLYLRRPLACSSIPVTDPLRTMLEKKGYVAVRLVQEEYGHFVAECKCGSEAFRLHLDTGAEFSALDMRLVKKLGLKPQGAATGVGIGGTLEGVKVSLRGLSIGDFDMRTTTESLNVVGFDFTAVNAALAQHRKLRPIDGVLGHSHLEVYSAVIDYPNRTLYLRSPLNGLWPEIEGKWVAIEGQAEGRDVPLDPKTPIRVEFKDRQFRLSIGTDQFLCGMHVKPGKDRYTMVFFHPEQELAKELEYRAGGLLKVSGGKLTLCLALDPEAAMGLPVTAKGLPDDFKAPAGSGHLLLEFRREK